MKHQNTVQQLPTIISKSQSIGQNITYESIIEHEEFVKNAAILVNPEKEQQIISEQSRLNKIAFRPQKHHGNIKSLAVDDLIKRQRDFRTNDFLENQLIVQNVNLMAILTPQEQARIATRRKYQAPAQTNHLVNYTNFQLHENEKVVERFRREKDAARRLSSLKQTRDHSVQLSADLRPSLKSRGILK